MAEESDGDIETKSLRYDKIGVYTSLMILYLVATYKLFKRHRQYANFYFNHLYFENLTFSGITQSQYIYFTSSHFWVKSQKPDWFLDINHYLSDFAMDIGSYMVQTPLILVFSLTDSQCWLSLCFVSLTKLSTSLDLIICQASLYILLKDLKLLNPISPLIFSI